MVRFSVVFGFRTFYSGIFAVFYLTMMADWNSVTLT